ncbi:hypothetical protein BV898_04815 [Hypsibius exemplaris]|uniref:Uncharacterized protein n=1 Tax=Hypsibius exemplaris TaxID=2072580 RepID=A0A1W0X1J4_HYPEX|nr:hypothetical protein BV898_04815 [Hypsibius exemplaris]
MKCCHLQLFDFSRRTLGSVRRSAVECITEWQVRLGLEKRLNDDRTFQTKLEKSGSLEFHGGHLLQEIDELIQRKPSLPERRRIPTEAFTRCCISLGSRLCMLLYLRLCHPVLRDAAREYEEEAKQLFILRNYEGSLDRIDKAFHHCPDSAVCLILKAAVLRRQNRFQEGLDLLSTVGNIDRRELAVEAREQRVVLLLNDWAVYRCGKGRMKRTQELLRTAVGMNDISQISVVHLNRSIVQEQMDGWSDAKVAFTKATISSWRAKNKMGRRLDGRRKSCC